MIVFLPSYNNKSQIMKSAYFLLFSILMIGFVSCKSDKQSTSIADDAVITMETQLKATPNLENANKLISELSKAMNKKHENPADLKNIMDRGIELTNEYNLPARSIPFLLNYLKEYPNDPSTKDKMYELAVLMNSIKKPHAANILYKSFATRYPDDARSNDVVTKLTEPIDDVNAYVIKQGEKIFENPDQYGLNKLNAQHYVDVCEAYALGNPDSETAPVNLYKAAEIARSLRTFPKTLSLYDWISEKYPNFDKAPTTLFLKGFIIENELKNAELAKSIYTEFLEKYPDNDLADDVKFLVENIGKSNEEILKIIEDKKESAAPATK